MKKILTSLLILPILFTAACGSNNHDANATPAEYFNYTIIEQQKYVVIDGYIDGKKIPARCWALTALLAALTFWLALLKNLISFQ